MLVNSTFYQYSRRSDGRYERHVTPDHSRPMERTAMATSNVTSESESRKPLTAERLRELMFYDPITGLFMWRTGLGRRNKQEGKIAGAVNGKGGIVIRIDRRMYHASRLAWLYVHGEWPSGFVDHRNRNRADNSLKNLRPADRIQNGGNQLKSKRNTSGFRGVDLVKATGKWRATIRHSGVLHFLGGFSTKEEAAAAYRAAAIRLRGEFSGYD